eukprot:15466141-Alexandrium_andersonii.AAC.1
MPGCGEPLQPMEAAGAEEARRAACRGVPLQGRPSAALACLACCPRGSRAPRPPRRLVRSWQSLFSALHRRAPPRGAALAA